MLWEVHKQVPEHTEEEVSLLFRPLPAILLILNIFCKEQQAFSPLNHKKMIVRNHAAQFCPLVVALTIYIIDQLSDFSFKRRAFNFSFKILGLRVINHPSPTNN